MTKARIQFKNGKKAPDNRGGENFWHKVKGNFPHHVVVPYMSEKDVDPRTLNQTLTRDFIRVPFNGLTHFGFMHKHHFEKFKMERGL